MIANWIYVWGISLTWKILGLNNWVLCILKREPPTSMGNVIGIIEVRELGTDVVYVGIPTPKTELLMNLHSEKLVDNFVHMHEISKEKLVEWRSVRDRLYSDHVISPNERAYIQVFGVDSVIETSPGCEFG